MSYSTSLIGYTGPAGRIGSGSAYHIDSKYASSLPWEEVDRRFQAKASRYAEDGRNIVFSNEGMNYATYDPAAPLEQRIALLQKAAGAHAERPGWNSFDYYAPLKGKDVWDESAEGAPIYLAAPDSQRVRGGRAEDYGNYAYASDAEGNVTAKIGHGDTQLPVYSGNQAVNPGGKVVVNNYYGDGTEVKQKKKQSFSSMLTQSLLTEALNRKKEPDLISAMIEDMMQSGYGKLDPLSIYN